MSKFRRPIGDWGAVYDNLLPQQVNNPIVGHFARCVQRSFAAEIKSDRCIADFNNQQCRRRVSRNLARASCDDGEVRLRFGVVANNDGKLYTDDIALSKCASQGVVGKHDREGVLISVRAYLNDFSVDQLDALAIKQSRCGHAVVFFPQPAARFWLSH